MRIFLDPQIFIEQKFGGISRCFGEIWKELDEQEGIDVECPLLFSNNLHIKELDLKAKFRTDILDKVNFKGKSRIRDGIKRYSYRYSAKRIRKNNYDLFVPTYYSTYFLENLRKPFVLTVYDMIHELYPQNFTPDKTIENKKLLIEKASKIIAISQNTKDDILKFYPGVEPEKIEVVHLAQSIKDVCPEVQSHNLPEKYLLFVGNRNHYKNFRFLVKAVAPLLQSINGLYLVCAGGGKFSVKENEFLSENKIADKVLQFDYADSELGAFYSKAQAFIFPSQYEGFGIPVLEAMKCRCPVILSRSSCFPEVAGDSALYFEENDIDSLRAVVDEVLSDSTTRSRLIAKGIEREKEFSWHKTVNACLNVYKSVL